MKILIIGGTGVISTDVCRKAIELQYEVDIVNRGKRKNNINPVANLIVADVRKESKEALRNKIGRSYYDVVVDFLSYDKVQLMKLLPIVKCNQYIFVSSATIYDEHSGEHIYKESDAKGNRGWDYCFKKYDCELELIDKAAKYGINYTIVRPYVTYNKNRFPYQISPVEYYTIVDRIIRQRPIAICNSLYTTLTDSRDFAIGMVGLFGNQKAYNEDFHITTDFTSTWKYSASLLASCFKVKLNFVELNSDTIAKFSDSIIDIDEIIYDKARNMKFDNTKIKNVVSNFNPERKLDDSIEEIYKYFSENMDKLTINYMWAGCLDRLLKPYVGNRSGEYQFKCVKDRMKYEIGYSKFLSKIYLSIKKIKRLINV